LWMAIAIFLATLVAIHAKRPTVAWLRVRRFSYDVQLSPATGMGPPERSFAMSMGPP
jgi:hypothetical protein